MIKHELKIIESIAEVLIPLSPEAKEMNMLIERVASHVGCAKPEHRFLYRFCLWFVELVAFFYYGSFKLMSQMDVELRNRYINAWHNTRWSVKRTVKRFLEAIIFMNYYSMPHVGLKVCGYEPKFKEPLSTRDFPSANLINIKPDKNIFEEVDVCVVGSGAGGAVVAKELAEKGRSVVILEEGGYFTDKDYDKDVVSTTKMLYHGGGVMNTFGWPPILVPIGSCVGGTTLINSGTCFRLPDDIFENWVERYGLHTWSPAQMEGHYREVEKILEVAPAEEEMQSKGAAFFAKGLNALGHTMMPLTRNAPKCCGSGVCCFGCPTNAKNSVQLNYIPLALRAGARLYVGCQAIQIISRRRHATEVIGKFKNGRRITVKAKIIISACGSLHTPVLLLNSRVPNISGQIGRNLTLHPAAKVMALFDEELCAWKGVPQGYYTDALVDDGIKIEGIFLPPAYTASSLLLTGRAHHDVMEQYNHLALFGMMVSDTSRGRIFRDVSGHALAFYNINRIDLPKYRRGIQFLADVFLKAGARKVFLPLHTLPQLTKEEGLNPLIELKLRNKDLDLQAFHPLGTCRMGADPREAVLDPFARVYGLDNLFVADGSIFPTSLGVNPMLTIMAAAHKIAGHVHREFL